MDSETQSILIRVIVFCSSVVSGLLIASIIARKSKGAGNNRVVRLNDDMVVVVKSSSGGMYLVTARDLKAMIDRLGRADQHLVLPTNEQNKQGD